MRWKRLTDKLLEYIFNRVVGPQIEYLTQLTIFTPAECRAICAPVRTLFKNKMGLAVSAPNYITDCPLIYNVFSLSNLQLKSHISKLHKQVNNNLLLGRIIRIKALHLQTVEWLVGYLLLRYPVGHTNM